MSTAPSPSTSLLRVSGVHFHYGSYHALDDVTFEVHGGEIAALVGRNGAGKSTLMRCIAGWTPLRDGDVLIDGVSLRQSERSYRQHLLLVPDVPVFYPELTAWENLQFIAQVRGQRGWQEEAERRLSVFGLLEHRTAYPSSFSRGMQYKLALSLALLAQPELLLLDEPFGPLDPLSATALWDEIRAYTEGGGAVLMSSHQLPRDVQPDRFIALEGGRVLIDGSTEGLARRFGLPEVTGDALIRSALSSGGDLTR